MSNKHEENTILEKRNGKVYLSHSYLFSLIEKFSKFHSLDSFESFELFLKNKIGWRNNISIKEIFSDFIRKEEKIKTMLWNTISKQLFKDFFDWKLTDKYESDFKWERNIEMYDVNDKHLSKTTYKKAITYKNNWKGDWIEEWKVFKFNHPILDDVDPLDTVFNKAYKEQGWKCAVSGKRLAYEEASFHHKYIPQCIMKYNAPWNVEILSHEEHEKKHQDKFAIVNILINIVSLKKKLKRAGKRKINRIRNKLYFSFYPKIKIKLASLIWNWKK